MSMDKFKADANIMPMMEKMIMQVMSKNGMLTGNKTFAVVREVQNQSTLAVVMQQSGDTEIVNCTPAIEFDMGDRVIVEYINNNPHDKFVMGILSKGTGATLEPLDYSKLPTEPVEIFRDDNDNLAESFVYGYDDPETTWSQRLIRSEETGVVVDILHSYPDGAVFTRTLYRDDKDRVYKYE